MKKIIILLSSLSLQLAAFSAVATPLFNGKNFDGWIQRGGTAKFHIENNEIVGSTVLNSPNTYLCTVKNYGDFILEFEFKVHPLLNSGVQIRSECVDYPKKVAEGGRLSETPAGRVHGCQVEIDPDTSRNFWNGGIYYEAGRGWLYPRGVFDHENRRWLFPGSEHQGVALRETSLRVFKHNDWNHIRVEAVGDSIKTWLNGEPCADLIDTTIMSGFIALQVHSIDSNPKKSEMIGIQVRFRNLLITELKPTK